MSNTSFIPVPPQNNFFTFHLKLVYVWTFLHLRTQTIPQLYATDGNTKHVPGRIRTLCTLKLNCPLK